LNKLFADNQQKVIATIRDWGKANSVPDRYVKRIVDRLLPSIRLVPKRGGTSPKGSSRIGGLPDLPEETPWPRVDPKDEESPPMSFVMQVSLAEVGGFDVDKVLPAEGLLSLFYYWDDDWGGDEGRVLFFPAPVPALSRLKAPDDLPEEGRYRAFSLRPCPEWTMPNLDALGLWDELSLELWFALEDQIDEAQGLARAGRRHRMLGHPDLVQSSGLPRGSVLLLQVSSDDSDEGPGISWGDGGTLYCYLSKSKLLARQFDRALFMLEMG
jgi:uncharacterized protein YwqG